MAFEKKETRRVVVSPPVTVPKTTPVPHKTPDQPTQPSKS